MWILLLLPVAQAPTPRSRQTPSCHHKANPSSPERQELRSGQTRGWPTQACCPAGTGLEPDCLYPAPLPPAPSLHPPMPPLALLRAVTTPCGLAFKASCLKPRPPLTPAPFSSLQSGHPHQHPAGKSPQHQKEAGAQRRPETVSGSTPRQESHTATTPLCLVGAVLLPFALLLPRPPQQKPLLAFLVPGEMTVL